MADQRLRELEREAASGDPGAFDQLIQYIVRIIGLDEAQAAARYHFPNLYEWCLAAIQHDTVYYVQEWFPMTSHQPVRAYLKYFTIKFDDQNKPQLSQCWLLDDRKSPHYEELANSLRWIEIDRHPWGQHFCFLGSGYENKLDDIFRVFGLKMSQHRILPHLRRLFSVVPNTYLEQFEEDEYFGYDLDDDDDDDPSAICESCGGILDDGTFIAEGEAMLCGDCS
jgi:hypothetical protein